MPSEGIGEQMTQPIKIAILAMGGEGGGVLADWIVDMGEASRSEEHTSELQSP